ncbi:hypothetical protein BDW75DRAFT_197332 [Aspergillus navahoensis]
MDAASAQLMFLGQRPNFDSLRRTRDSMSIASCTSNSCKTERTTPPIPARLIYSPPTPQSSTILAAQITKAWSFRSSRHPAPTPTESLPPFHSGVVRRTMLLFLTQGSLHASAKEMVHDSLDSSGDLYSEDEYGINWGFLVPQKAQVKAQSRWPTPSHPPPPRRDTQA